MAICFWEATFSYKSYHLSDCYWLYISCKNNISCKINIEISITLSNQYETIRSILHKTDDGYSCNHAEWAWCKDMKETTGLNELWDMCKSSHFLQRYHFLQSCNPVGIEPYCTKQLFFTCVSKVSFCILDYAFTTGLCAMHATFLYEPWMLRKLRHNSQSTPCAKVVWDPISYTVKHSPKPSLESWGHVLLKSSQMVVTNYWEPQFAKF